MEDLFSKVLIIFDKSDMWRDGVELVGSWSFLMYQRHLSVRKMPLRTLDVDFLLPRPYPDRMTVDLAVKLKEIGFTKEIAMSGTTFFVHPELKIEFLIPERGRGDSDFYLVSALGIRAIPLRFVDMLLKDPITVEDSGVLIRIPNPLAFCLHKLLIAQRRKDNFKRERDIEQAIYVLEILEIEHVKIAMNELPKKWRRLIEKSLAQAWILIPLERPLLRKHGFELEI